MKKIRLIDADALATRIFDAMCTNCLDECAACPWWDALNLIKKAKTVSANDIARFPTATGWISDKEVARIIADLHEWEQYLKHLDKKPGGGDAG